MALANALTMRATSVLVALLLALGPTTGAGQRPLHLLGANNTAEDDLQCPAVCPACPSCPGAPPCPIAPPCPRRIPPGYKLHEGLGYYKMHYEEKSWEDAKAACEREGGYLVVLNSQSEANLASSFFTTHGLTGYMHIGFFDVNKKGKYTTVLDGMMSSSGYVVWAPGEPNNVGGENCGSFLPNRGLNDVTCANMLPFLCELFT